MLKGGLPAGGLCHEVHAADRAAAGLVADDLWMHRADVFRVEVFLRMFQRTVFAGLGQRLARRVRGRPIGSETAAQQTDEDRDGQQCPHLNRHGKNDLFVSVHSSIQLTRSVMGRPCSVAPEHGTVMAESAEADRRAVQTVVGRPRQGVGQSGAVAGVAGRAPVRVGRPLQRAGRCRLIAALALDGWRIAVAVRTVGMRCCRRRRADVCMAGHLAVCRQSRVRRIACREHQVWLRARQERCTSQQNREHHAQPCAVAW